MENTSFSEFSAGLHPAAVGRISIFGGLAAIFVGLEFAGLLCHAFCRQKFRLRLTQICQLYFRPSPWNVTG
jgi:hypothetical protein